MVCRNLTIAFMEWNEFLNDYHVHDIILLRKISSGPSSIRQ